MVLAVLAVIAIFCLLISLATYIVVQQYVKNNAEVVLPEGYESFLSDATDFNESLKTVRQDPCFNLDLCKVVTSIVEDLKSGKAAPLNHSLFVDAVSKCNQRGRSITENERSKLKSILDDSAPKLQFYNQTVRIIGTRIDNDGSLAVVDFIVGNRAGALMSDQWFLAKTADGWQLYDWQRLEIGRRTAGTQEDQAAG